MRRRDLLPLILSAALDWPQPGRAEIGAAVPCIAIASQRDLEGIQRYLTVFFEALKKYHLLKNRDYTIVLRSTGGDAAHVAPLFAELIALKPAVIMTNDTPLTIAAKRATPDIPIVAVLFGDPVGFGLAASLAHPGGNVTGLLSGIDRIVPKQLELLHQVVPAATRVGVLFNADNPANVGGVKVVQQDPAFRSLKFVTAPLRQSSELDGAIEDFAREHVEAVLVFQDALFSRNAARIAKLALAARLPTVFGFRFFVEAGGLMSYGIDLVAQWQRAAILVEKILKGANPADLPIEMNPNLELVINMKTAKALGLAVPPAVLAFANDVLD